MHVRAAADDEARRACALLPAATLGAVNVESAIDTRCDASLPTIFWLLHSYNAGRVESVESLRRGKKGAAWGSNHTHAKKRGSQRFLGMNRVDFRGVGGLEPI